MDYAYKRKEKNALISPKPPQINRYRPIWENTCLYTLPASLIEVFYDSLQKQKEDAPCGRMVPGIQPGTVPAPILQPESIPKDKPPIPVQRTQKPCLS